MIRKKSEMRKAPKGRSFGSRNPTTIGAIGLMLIAVLLWAAFNAADLPIIGGGTTYHAYFTEAAGVKANDEVRIAGVKVGTVTSVTLEGDHVNVTFRIKQAYVGDQSTAAIKIKTLLGAKYLSVNPIGGGKLRADGVIPITRTVAPFDIYPTVQQLTQTVGEIGKARLGQAFQTIADTFTNSPETIKSALTGLSSLSDSISSRDEALRGLLAKTNDVTTIVASRDAQIAQLINDGGLLLDELNSRKTAINNLLVNTANVAAQLSGLVADNQAALQPALDQLNGVLAMLQATSDSISRGLQLVAPYLRLFTNVTGNGRWFNGYLRNVNNPSALVPGAGVLGPGVD